MEPSDSAACNLAVNATLASDEETPLVTAVKRTSHFKDEFTFQKLKEAMDEIKHLRLMVERVRILEIEVTYLRSKIS